MIWIRGQVVKSECTGDHGESIRKRETSREMAGGIQEADVNAEHVKSVAARLVAKLDADSGSDCKQKVNRILQASTQASFPIFFHIFRTIFE